MELPNKHLLNKNGEVINPATEDTLQHLTVAQGEPGQDPWPVVVVAALPIRSNNLVSISASTDPILLLPANDNRKALSIYNDSSDVLWIKFGSGITSSFYNFEMPKKSLWESEFYTFNGEIWGLWPTASGSALISELS